MHYFLYTLYLFQVFLTFFASKFVQCVLGGDDLSYLNVPIVAIVSGVLIVWAKLFSFALNLVVFPFLIVLDRWRGGGGL